MGEIFKEPCLEIEGNILKKPLLVIKLEDSSVEVKRLVTERTRIKELANDLCNELKLNILSSQITFFMTGAKSWENRVKNVPKIFVVDGLRKKN